MKTGSNSLFGPGWILCFCLVLSAMTVRCQSFGGIVANGGIDFKGIGVTIDSFDSSDPNHSIWQTNMTYHGVYYGVYSDTLSYVSNSFPSRTANALVATDGSIINVGNANVYGYVDTAPGGATSLSIDGSVGDLNWVYTGTSGIEPGHAFDDMNQQFFSKSLPIPTNSWQSAWMNVPSPPSGTIIKIGGTWTNIAGVWTNAGGTFYTNTGGAFNIGGVLYSLVITNRIQNTNYVYYSMNTLIQNLYVDAPNVVLYLTNGMNYSAKATFTLNTNADIQIYTTGNMAAGGQAVIDNAANYAHAFSIYDVAGSTNLAFLFAGNGLGVAYIYAPSSSITLSGGGSALYGFVGSIFCNNLQVNGNFNFHVDTSLGGISLPVAFDQQPANQIVQAGSNATFSVNANFATGYQWYFSTNNYWPNTNSVYAATNMISGATNSSLTITNVQLSDAGFYGVVASNSVSWERSASAYLTVYTNAAATLNGTFNPTNDDVYQFNVAGVAGLNYVIQASTNLTDWVPLWTNTSPFSFTETNMDIYPQRFYRSVYVP